MLEFFLPPEHLVSRVSKSLSLCVFSLSKDFLSRLVALKITTETKSLGIKVFPCKLLLRENALFPTIQSWIVLMKGSWDILVPYT